MDIVESIESYLYTFYNPFQLACLTVCGLDLPVKEVQLPDSQCSTAHKRQLMLAYSKSQKDILKVRMLRKKSRFLCVLNRDSSQNALTCTKFQWTPFTHLPADTKILSSVFEYCTVRQWPAPLAEAGLPQIACLVSMFHTTMLKTQRKPTHETNREYLLLSEFTYLVWKLL